MGFIYTKNLNGGTPQYEEGTAGGTILVGEILTKSSATVIRASAVTDAPLFIAANGAVSGGTVLMWPVLPGMVFEVPTENTTYVDATHKYLPIDAYDGGAMLDSVDPGATTYGTFMCLGLADGETAVAEAKVLVTPMFAFKLVDLDVS